MKREDTTATAKVAEAKGGSARGIRRIIFIGFGVLGVIMIAFFASRAGLHVALHERSEAIGTVQVITAQISTNSFQQ